MKKLVEKKNEGLRRVYQVTLTARERELAEADTGILTEIVQGLIEEYKLRPAVPPSMKFEEGGKAGEVVVTVSLETLPEVPVPRIEGLKLERLTVAPDDAMIDERLQQVIQAQRELAAIPTDDAAQAGDLVTIDFEGRIDGEPFEGGAAQGMSVKLGSGRLLPGFEDQLIGAKANEQRTLTVTFPEDFPAESLKGRPAAFAVMVTEVRRLRAANEDDELVKAMGLESIDQLRGIVRAKVEQELKDLTRTHMKRQLFDQLDALVDFPLPPSLVETEFAGIWQQAEHAASLEAARAELEQERDEYRAIARRRVRLGLLLSAIGQANGVAAEQQDMDPSSPQAQLRAKSYEEKVVDFLFSKAEITDRAVTREELGQA